MSAAGRSDVRRTNDHYVTPAYAVRRFLEAYQPPLKEIKTHESQPQSEIWCDPCGANGELLGVVKEMRPDVSLIAFEIRPECRAALDRVTRGNALIGDFLEISKEIPDKSIDCVITNFPFSLAEEFLVVCRRIAHVTITLQRINWIRGNGRHRLMAEARPGLFVLPERPSFTGRGSDATEYCFYCFDDPKVAGTWQMLGETPEEERAAANKWARVLHPVASETQETA